MRRLRSVFTLGTIATLLAGGGASRAQQQSPGTRTEVVQLDVVVTDAEGKPVKRRAEVQAGAALEIEFADGRVGVRQAGAPAPPLSKAKPKPTAGQGDLF